MNTIELAVTDTKLTSLPAIANLASVLENYLEGRIWLVENHLNMISYSLGNNYSQNDKRNFWIDFSTYDSFYVGRTWESCWMIRKKIHLRDYIDKKWLSFSQFCIDCLVRGYYIFATVNTAYIPDYGWVGRHQIFIHGYSYDRKMFLCSDFFGGNAKYCRKWIRADELDNAYKYLYDVSSIDDFEGVCLWKFDSHTYCYDNEYGVQNLTTLDICHVRNVLQMYLNGQSEKGKSSNSAVCYGLNVYDALKRHLVDCDDCNCPVSVQPVYLIKDHLTILSMLLDMLESNNKNQALISKLDQLQKAWNRLAMSIIKYDIYVDIGKARTTIVDSICNQINHYADDERKFIIQLINSMEQYS